MGSSITNTSEVGGLTYEQYVAEIYEGAVDLLNEFLPDFVPIEHTNLVVMPKLGGSIVGARYEGKLANLGHGVQLWANFDLSTDELSWDNYRCTTDIMLLMHELLHQKTAEVWGMSNYFSPEYAAFCATQLTMCKTVAQAVQLVSAAHTANPFPNVYRRPLQAAVTEGIAFLGEKCIQKQTDLPVAHIDWYENNFGYVADRIVQTLSEVTEYTDAPGLMTKLINIDLQQLNAFETSAEFAGWVSGDYHLGRFLQLVEDCQR
jgi:hypothetical protein